MVEMSAHIIWFIFINSSEFLLKDTPCIYVSAQTADTDLRHLQIIILPIFCKNDKFVIHSQYSLLLWWFLVVIMNEKMPSFKHVSLD